MSRRNKRTQWPIGRASPSCWHIASIRSSTMAQSQTVSAATPPQIDWLTLIAISALGSVVGVLLHEHLGHTAACVLLGSRPTELGAFYSDCDYSGMSDTSIRLVALAGPLVSLLIFGVCSLVLRRVPTRAPVAT